MGNREEELDTSINLTHQLISSFRVRGGGDNLNGYYIIDSPYMVSQYLPILFVDPNPIIKEILSKNPKSVTYDPRLSPKGGPGEI